MKWNKNTKETLSYLFAALTLVVGLGLSVAGFIIDPRGEIHESVLWILGQCLTFVGAVCGISLHVKGQYNEIKAEILEELRDVNVK